MYWIFCIKKLQLFAIEDLSLMGLCWWVSFIVLWFHGFFFLVYSLISCVYCMSMVLFMTFYYGFVSWLAMLYILLRLLYIHVGSVGDEWLWLINAFEKKSWWMVVVNKFVYSLAIWCVYFCLYIFLNEWWWLDVYIYWEESIASGLYTNVPEVLI